MALTANYSLLLRMNLPLFKSDIRWERTEIENVGDIFHVVLIS